MRITSINASHGGRAHDSRVFALSELSRRLREKYEAGVRDCWLLGNIASLLDYHPARAIFVTPCGSRVLGFAQRQLYAVSSTE